MSEPSPRSAAEPMAFTRVEFVRGALSAWLWFLLLDIVAYGVVFFPVGWIYGAIGAVPTATAAAVVFAAPAWWLARALRRSGRVALHVAAFAALGAVIGVIATAAFMVVVTGRFEVFYLGFPLVPINIVAATCAMILGWRRGARAVLRPDAAPRRPDVDTEAEDAIVDAAAVGRHAREPAVVDAPTAAERAALATRRSARSEQDRAAR